MIKVSWRDCLYCDTLSQQVTRQLYQNNIWFSRRLLQMTWRTHSSCLASKLWNILYSSINNTYLRCQRRISCLHLYDICQHLLTCISQRVYSVDTFQCWQLLPIHCSSFWPNLVGCMTHPTHTQSCLYAWNTQN